MAVEKYIFIFLDLSRSLVGTVGHKKQAEGFKKRASYSGDDEEYQNVLGGKNKGAVRVEFFGRRYCCL